ncbi:MAG TPA: hypothetical protein VJM34_13735, partial [Novosphingobium sp.]|nr:hypothetical protein [Novosphingobium sp.]
MWHPQRAAGDGSQILGKPASPFWYFDSSPEVIRLVVMLWVRFPLSLRNIRTCFSSAASTFAM